MNGASGGYQYPLPPEFQTDPELTPGWKKPGTPPALPPPEEAAPGLPMAPWTPGIPEVPSPAALGFTQDEWQHFLGDATRGSLPGTPAVPPVPAYSTLPSRMPESMVTPMGFDRDNAMLMSQQAAMLSQSNDLQARVLGEISAGNNANAALLRQVATKPDSLQAEVRRLGSQSNLHGESWVDPGIRGTGGGNQPNIGGWG